MKNPLDVPLDRNSDPVIYEWSVPKDLRSDVGDVPDAYRVVELKPIRGGCMIWGAYTSHRLEPEWIANVTARALVRHLIGKAGSAVDDYKASCAPRTTPPTVEEFERHAAKHGPYLRVKRNGVWIQAKVRVVRPSEWKDWPRDDPPYLTAEIFREKNPSVSHSVTFDEFENSEPIEVQFCDADGWPVPWENVREVTPAATTDSHGCVSMVSGKPHRLEGPCCSRANEYNGFGSDGPLAFVCPAGCPCHD